LKGGSRTAALFLWEPDLKIHREGYPFIAIFVAVNLLAFLLAAWLGWALLPITIWCVAFFRDPDRKTPA
jgi:phosphatidylserine decarboxylase